MKQDASFSSCQRHADARWPYCRLQLARSYLHSPCHSSPPSLVHLLHACGTAQECLCLVVVSSWKTKRPETPIRLGGIDKRRQEEEERTNENADTADEKNYIITSVDVTNEHAMAFFYVRGQKRKRELHTHTHTHAHGNTRIHTHARTRHRYFSCIFTPFVSKGTAESTRH